MNGTPDDDIRVFTEALRLPGPERPAFVQRECGSNLQLAQRVNALLEAHGRVGEFMESGLPAVAGQRLAESVGEKPGDRIGRYKLLQQIGEGGCGVVYMAEQEEPVRRRVALKIIKPGMDTKSVIARFEAERQALALMDHPNIAKIFDAGATESGRPYFVMELVRGVKITDYCDQNSVTTEARLELFVLVCEAVQHAHQKGIIHRDLKPSNILVTVTAEGAATPMVIDFGIAKATTNQRLTDKTLFTAFDMLIGTPAYMSPEQAVFASADVDTRTDIYSLGVLLYELLTGTTPFDAGELLKAGLDEVRRVIREREPIRPSTRLSRLTPENLTSVAQQRRADAPQLVRAVSGDLDWIVMKALEKDRVRRYETANGLALDVARFLDDEAISARPPSTWYRARKTVLRHKVWFSSLGVIMALLVLGLALISRSLAMERQARRETGAALQQAEIDKAKGEAETAKSRAVTQFLEDMLQSVGPSVALGRDTVLLREILEKAATRVGTELVDQPGTRAELQLKIGGVYLQLALHDQAEAMLRAALAGYEHVHGSESAEVAGVLSDLALVRMKRGDLAEAEQLYRDVLARRRKLFGPENPGVAATIRDLGKALMAQGKFAEGAPLRREALEMQRRLAGLKGLETNEYLEALNASLTLATEEGRHGDAEATAREALALRRKMLGPAHPQVAAALHSLNLVLASEEKLAEAEVSCREELGLRRKLVGDVHPDVAATLIVLGQILQKGERYPEAEGVLREALAMRRKFLADETPLSIGTLRSLGQVLRGQSKLAEAEGIHWQALGLGRKVFGDRHSFVARLATSLLAVLADEGKFGEADPLIAEFLPADFVAQPQSAPFLRAQVDLLVRENRWAEARGAASRATQHRPADPEGYAQLAPLLARAKDREAYRRLCREIVAHFSGTGEPEIASQMAKDCLLLPVPGMELQVIDQLSATAIAAGKGRKDWPAFQLTRALAEYRQGHFAGAVEWAQKSLAGRAPGYVQAQAELVLALALFQSKHHEEARGALGKAAELLRARGFSPAGNDPGSDWAEWIFADCLGEEAAGLLAAEENSSTKI